jgi:hypothetical protein
VSTSNSDSASVSTATSSARAHLPGSVGPRRRRRGLLHAALSTASVLVLGVALAGAAAPVVTVEDAANVEFTTASVKGEVNPEGKETSYHFEYATEADFSNASAEGFGSTESTTTPEAQLTGLQPGTTYHLRLVASNEDGETAIEATNTFTTKPVAKPIVTGLAASETHFSGMVNPNAPEENALLSQAAKNAYATHWSFTCEPGCNFSGPSEGDLDADNSATEVSADPTGLQPNKSYDVTLHATNAGGEEIETKGAAFTTPAVGPTIDRETLWEPTSTSIQLNAIVNAHNSVLTACGFEYGTTATYGTSVPCEARFPDDSYTAPEDNADHVISARLADLAPSTEYHFRLVAANASGAEQGEDRTFTTLAEPDEESCPNEPIREAQRSTQLPDCRAFEKVSPADKGNGDIVGDGDTTVAAKLGDAVAFNSRTNFGDTVGSGSIGHTQYVARRSGQGWDVHAITPTPRPDAKQTLFAPTFFPFYSEDLRTAMGRAYDLPGATDDEPLRNNLYVEDTATRALRTITKSQVDKVSAFDFIQFPAPFWGISADARHVAFVSEETPFGVTQFLPDAAQGVPNVYKWDEGVLSLAGILPDGTVPPSGSTSPPNLRGAMSADGSRLLFYASIGGNSQLYLRIDGQRTAWVSQTELKPSDPSYNPDPGSVEAVGMTPDGRNVFFTTDTPLLAEDDNAGPDLYRYTDSADPDGDSNLTLISHNGSFITAGVFIGMSDNGARVYYRVPGEGLTLWNQGATRVITAVASLSADPELGVGLSAARPGYGRVTPDGSFLVVGTDATTDGVHGLTGQLINGHREMYLYSLKDDTLRCVSCPLGPATSDATVTPAATEVNLKVGYAGFRPRFLSDSGQVFFSTADALVPQDTNGVLDTYKYDPAAGSMRLLSTGGGKTPSTFADASKNGDDVFLVTRQRFVPSDQDDLVDVYDVRSGGGFSEPVQVPAFPCQGEGCQGAVGGALAAVTPASRAAKRGNLAPRRSRCSRRVRMRHPNIRKHCAKKAHGHRAANTNRRVAR